MTAKSAVLGLGLGGVLSAAHALEDPPGGALGGERPRLVVSTDIGGSDPDDFQSMVHLLVYADVLDIEGLVSSPPKGGRKRHILETLDAYEKDYANLRSHSPSFPPPGRLRSVSKQGATEPAPPKGWSQPTDGSRWITGQALTDDERPLYVLVWGSITDVAQAVHDDPAIKKRIRVYSIGSWNTAQDRSARDYLYGKHADLWWIECDTTFRGMYVGGEQGGELGNSEFVRRHVKGHGALGDFFYAKKRSIKMGDTPSVLYLLRGDPARPASEHWGGRFVATAHGPGHWHDDPDRALKEKGRKGARTVSKWRESYLRDWQARMDWCRGPRASVRDRGEGKAQEHTR